MPFFESVRIAWQAIAGQKLRSALTLLGMVIGVFSVIASVTAVEVIETTFVSTLSGMGAGTITIQREGDGIRFGDEAPRRPLTYAQALALQRRATLPLSVSPSLMQWGATLRAGGETTDPNVRLTGSDEHHAASNGMEVAAGRFLTADDVQVARPVAVLGATVAEELFGEREAVGREVRIDGRRYLVVGVLARRSGGFGFMDPNNLAVLPITRLLATYSVTDDVMIDVRAPRPELAAATQDEVVGLLRAIRHVRPEAENDFDVSSSEAMAESVRGFTSKLALGGAGIGFIALLAAGIGVMNILLVSVAERTREIGIRKAMGATPSAILRQFLVEAVILCQIGGLLGVALGLAGGNVVALLMRNAPAFPWGWALGAVVGMVAVALVFGVYPAWKAARLAPIDALRYE